MWYLGLFHRQYNIAEILNYISFENIKKNINILLIYLCKLIIYIYKYEDNKHVYCSLSTTISLSHTHTTLSKGNTATTEDTTMNSDDDDDDDAKSLEDADEDGVLDRGEAASSQGYHNVVSMSYRCSCTMALVGGDLLGIQTIS